MYPDSLLQWLGYLAVVFGVLTGVGALGWWVHNRYGSRDDGRTALWAVFEVLSAILVVTSLLVAIYSDSRVLRAVAGLALVVVVSAATALLMERMAPKP